MITFIEHFTISRMVLLVLRFATKIYVAICRFGCANEKSVRSRYENFMRENHGNISVEDAGLHIHPACFYLGATPDGFVSCSCCGRGIFEIKCPFSKSNCTVQEAVEDKNFYLRLNNGRIQLCEKHSYYFQVQLQLFVTQESYCDFVCLIGSELFIQRIFAHKNFVTSRLQRLNSFYLHGVLPELLAKWHTSASTKSRQLKVIINFS